MSDEEVESVNISTPSTPYSHSHSKPVVASHAVSTSTASVGALAEPVIATAETAPATSATTSTPASATVHVPAVQRHRLQPAGQVLVRLTNQLDQILHEVAVLVVEEGGGQAKVTHPPSSADSVHILLNVTGHVKVDHVFHVGDVKTSRRYCCCNNDWRLTNLEPGKGFKLCTILWKEAPKSD